jgi:NADH-quinone oxidoreductase subunit N
VIGLLNSGVACFYYLRLLAAVYTKPGAESARLSQLRPISVPAAVGLALAAIATLTLGILPNGAVSFAEYASHSTLIEQGRQECAAHPDCHIQLQFDAR